MVMDDELSDHVEFLLKNSGLRGQRGSRVMRRRRNSGWYCDTYLRLGHWTLEEYNAVMARLPNPLPPAHSVVEALRVAGRLRKEDKRRLRKPA